MSKPAATKYDVVTATDQHRVQGALVPVPFNGVIVGDVASTVLIEKVPAARIKSKAQNSPAHVPPPGKAFDNPPTNEGRITMSLGKNVLVENWPLARDGDPVKTCDDTDGTTGVVVAAGSVLVGDG